MGKRAKSIKSECEMVSRKVEKGTCFRELSSKASMTSRQHLESQIWCLKRNKQKLYGYVIWHARRRTLWKRRYWKKETNYRQLAFEIRKRRPRFKVKVVLLVISAFVAGLKELLKELEKMFEKDDLCERIVAEMQKTILMNSETIIRKVLSGLVQSDGINSW